MLKKTLFVIQTSLRFYLFMAVALGILFFFNVTLILQVSGDCYAVFFYIIIIFFPGKKDVQKKRKILDAMKK